MNIPNTYDKLIEQAAAKYLPMLDWRWLKAQAWCESRLNPNAVSPAGAKGPMQFMPPTWAEAVTHLRLPESAQPTNPEYAFPAGAWYDRRMWEIWKSPRPTIDRLRLMFASYNAGAGNIIEAQELADYAHLAQPILDQLHRVTGIDNATETRQYVARIERTYHELTGQQG